MLRNISVEFARNRGAVMCSQCLNFLTIGTIHNTFVCKEVNEITVIVMVCHGHMVI